MATYNLRRFSHPDGLKAIAEEPLIALLQPHAAFFNGRGVSLPPPGQADGLDYEGIVQVFMTPDSDTPKELADAL